MPHVALVGKGVRKVSWKVARNFRDYHRVWTQQDGVIVTRCGITVPNVPTCFTMSGTPVDDTCRVCFPPEPEAA